MLGSQGKTVELIEAMFGPKRKYNRGKIDIGTWVFDMVERGTGMAFTLSNRTKETLVTGQVQHFVAPATMIVSDKFFALL